MISIDEAGKILKRKIGSGGPGGPSL